MSMGKGDHRARATPWARPPGKAAGKALHKDGKGMSLGKGNPPGKGPKGKPGMELLSLLEPNEQNDDQVLTYLRSLLNAGAEKSDQQVLEEFRAAYGYYPNIARLDGKLMREFAPAGGEWAAEKGMSEWPAEKGGKGKGKGIMSEPAQEGNVRWMDPASIRFGGPDALAFEVLTRLGVEEVRRRGLTDPTEIENLLNQMLDDAGLHDDDIEDSD
jgi:hypothetical protein